MTPEAPSGITVARIQPCSLTPKGERHPEAVVDAPLTRKGREREGSIDLWFDFQTWQQYAAHPEERVVP